MVWNIDLDDFQRICPLSTRDYTLMSLMKEVLDDSLPPTNSPTDQPTGNPPTDGPTDAPTNLPTNEPTDAPTNRPTNPPTNGPTDTGNNNTNLFIIFGTVKIGVHRICLHVITSYL